MMLSVGIHAISTYLPEIYLPIQDLASLRGIEAAKLEKGLGLSKMSLCDADENVATMAAEAVLKLLETEQISPEEIGRLYLGTESSLDGAKPTATYVLELLEAAYGQGSFAHCDTLDMTFACIGAVDAMHTCLDWIRVNPEKRAIVVAVDEAIYEPESSGEYTQGAGAIALLLQANPAIIEIHGEVGVSTSSVLDFYKPLRSINTTIIEKGLSSSGNQGLSFNEKTVHFHSSTPVFDGPYSNLCFQNRIEEAFTRYYQTAHKDAAVIQSWSQLIFHLPYAYHAQRVCQPIFLDALIAEGKLEAFCLANGLSMDLLDETQEFYKLLSKTPGYKDFVKEKLSAASRASSEAGNLYTASIFLALLSALTFGNQETKPGEKFGFFAYGSGSKSKVFAGTLSANWKEKIEKSDLKNTLDRRTAIHAAQYLQLRKGALKEAIQRGSRRFFVIQNTAEDHSRYAPAFTYKPSLVTSEEAIP